MGRDTYGVKGITLDDDDAVVAMATVDPAANLLAASALGSGKRTDMEEYRITHRGGKGIITMRVTEKTGRVVGVLMVTDEDQIMLITTAGKLIRLRVAEVRRSGRNTQGVRLIGLEPGEEVVAIARLAERDDPEAGSDGEGPNGSNGGNGVDDDGGGEEPDGDPV